MTHRGVRRASSEVNARIVVAKTFLLPTAFDRSILVPALCPDQRCALPPSA